MLLTISGLYGSGGNEIGRDLARMLGYTVYDNNLIEKAAEESGLDLSASALPFVDEQDAGMDKEIGNGPFRNAVLKLQMDVLPIGRTKDLPVSGLTNSGIDPYPSAEERTRSGLFSSFFNPSGRKKNAMISKKGDIDRLRFAQAKLILEAAEKGNAIFFGRCSSYILRGRKDTINIFTYAEMESCVKRISELYGIEDEEQVEELCRTTNLRRAYYYETFTSQKWNDVENYDFCINTDYLGYDGTLAFIKDLVEIRGEQG